MIRDKTGREIRHGDLIRFWHYKDARTRRNVYMYKLVVQSGGLRYAVDVMELPRYGTGAAYRCLLDSEYAAGCEIVDGEIERLPDGGIRTWYERPKDRTVRQ